MSPGIKNIYNILKRALQLFLRNDPLRMSGATAFFSMFSLPPILIIIVQFFSLFIDPQTIKHEIFSNLAETIGRQAVMQVVEVIRGFRKLAYNWFAAIAGFLFLIFVATTLFKVIRSSINQVWGMPHREKNISRGLLSRLQSLLVILVAGVLLSLGIFIEAIQVIVGKYFLQLSPSLSPALNRALNFIISTAIVAVWFSIIFRYLCDARPKWRVAWVGALFTSIFFSLGKMVLHLLLTYNNITTIYGASASVVLILLFVFYCAMILYFGASFTKVWADHKRETVYHIH
jgi:membrane protein